MGITDVEKVKDRCDIHKVGDAVAVLSKQFLLYDTDGALHFRFKGYTNVHKVLLLPERHILVDCGRQHAYIMLSMDDGTELWRIKHPVLHYTSGSFAYSPDYTFVYDYYSLKEDTYFVKINIVSAEIETYRLEPGLRAFNDLICDDKGIPCFLQSHYEIIAEERVSINGIRYEGLDPFTPGSAYYWKNKWVFKAPRISLCYLGDTETILTQDMHVYEPKSGNMYFLLENDPIQQLPEKRPILCRLDNSKRYITLVYMNANIVIDWQARKRIACYMSDLSEGCIVGDEFWVYTNTGVQRKPFPLMEELPKQKLTTMMGRGDGLCEP